MRPRHLLLPLLLAATAGTASAQTPQIPMPSQEEMQGMMGFARQAMNPAAQLLAHRSELELTTAQVAALDSLAAPMDRFLLEQMAPQIEPASLAVLKLMMDPAEKVNEEEIRAAFREQADRQADMIIRMARMEREVNQLLTPDQRAQRQKLELNSPFGMLRALVGDSAAPGR